MLKPLVTLLIASSVAPALAANQYFGPFVVSEANPTVAVLNGPIAPDTMIDFHRALTAFPAINTLGLNSPGGDVLAAITIALETHDRGISTVVTDTSACYSACAYIFFAGHSRTMEGQLGLHRFHADDPAPGQDVAIDLDLRYALKQFDVPYEVYDSVFNTPSDDLRVIDSAEAITLSLNR